MGLTCSRTETNKSPTQPNLLSQNATMVVNRIQPQNCKIYERYRGVSRCKLCLRKLHNRETVVILCRVRHRYHVDCVVGENAYKSCYCTDCRYLLNPSPAKLIAELYS
jgi:hypothetical protein